MTRLITTIAIVMVVAIYLAIVITDKVEMAVYYNDGEPFFAGQYRGTFDLLDAAIAKTEETNFQAVLHELKNRFRTHLRLEKRQGLDLPAKGLTILDSGAIYLHDLGISSSLYRTSIYPGLVWSIPIAKTATDQQIDAVAGTLILIKERLSSEEPHNLRLAMEEIQSSYDVPLNLNQLADFDIEYDDKLVLKTGQIVVKNPQESGERFLIQLDNSDLILQFGPIVYPKSLESRYWQLAIIFATIALLGIFLWIWPLCRDLQRLRRASLEIGSGSLGTRVRSHPASLIRPVLDGFNRMAVRTESMVESQRELTNAVSHEFRTPLARMMFDLQMAKDADNQTDRSRHLDSLNDNIGQMNSLVDELLTYAQQERADTALDLDTIATEDIKDWLSAQVVRAKCIHETACRIDINFIAQSTDQQSLQFSPRLMAHALSNALQNALRFARGNVIVQLQQHENEWILSVEDDGIGIPDDKHERMFEPFTRIDESRERGSGGFGLGLSIVRKIAQWHQGDAYLKPCETLSGTRVEIRWPVIAATAGNY